VTQKKTGYSPARKWGKNAMNAIALIAEETNIRYITSV
jgi:hypothetical protein